MDQRNQPLLAFTHSSAHACLKIDEVTRVIVAYLIDQDLRASAAAFALAFQYRCSRSLARAAGRKAFAHSDPARRFGRSKNIQ